MTLGRAVVYFLSIILYLQPSSGMFEVPRDSIYKKIDEKFQKISSPTKWLDFVAQNPDLFPPLGVGQPRTHIAVRKEIVKINGEEFTLGVGYRETFMPVPLTIASNILNSAHLYEHLYGLDAPSSVPHKSKDGEFRARIFKKVFGLEDQDYTLEYKTKFHGLFRFQRARLVSDATDFALRDNLNVVQASPGGVVFREISIIYPLRWYVRMFGPQMRQIMENELYKSTLAMQCAAKVFKSKKEISTPDAKGCWKKAQESKKLKKTKESKKTAKR